MAAISLPSWMLYGGGENKCRTELGTPLAMAVSLLYCTNSESVDKGALLYVANSTLQTHTHTLVQLQLMLEGLPQMLSNVYFGLMLCAVQQNISEN